MLAVLVALIAGTRPLIIAQLAEEAIVAFTNICIIIAARILQIGAISFLSTRCIWHASPTLIDHHAHKILVAIALTSGSIAITI
jgi:hypothetical protein